MRVVTANLPTRERKEERHEIETSHSERPLMLWQMERGKWKHYFFRQIFETLMEDLDLMSRSSTRLKVVKQNMMTK